MAKAELDPIDEVARMLALNLKRDRGMQDVIVELDSVGIPQWRIAELLGTSGGYVSVALTRARATAEQGKAKPRRSKPKGST